MHKRDFNMNFAILRLRVLHKLQLIVMYMYGGPLQSIQHLYLYGSVIMLKLGCDCGVCLFNTPNVRIVKINDIDQKNDNFIKIWFVGRVSHCG